MCRCCCCDRPVPESEEDDEAPREIGMQRLRRSAASIMNLRKVAQEQEQKDSNRNGQGVPDQDPVELSGDQRMGSVVSSVKSFPPFEPHELPPEIEDGK